MSLSSSVIDAMRTQLVLNKIREPVIIIVPFLCVSEREGATLKSALQSTCCSGEMGNKWQVKQRDD